HSAGGCGILAVRAFCARIDDDLCGRKSLLCWLYTAVTKRLLSIRKLSAPKFFGGSAKNILLRASRSAAHRFFWRTNRPATARAVRATLALRPCASSFSLRILSPCIRRRWLPG